MKSVVLDFTASTITLISIKRLEEEEKDRETYLVVRKPPVTHSAVLCKFGRTFSAKSKK